MTNERFLPVMRKVILACLPRRDSARRSGTLALHDNVRVWIALFQF